MISSAPDYWKLSEAIRETCERHFPGYAVGSIECRGTIQDDARFIASRSKPWPNGVTLGTLTYRLEISMLIAPHGPSFGDTK